MPTKVLILQIYFLKFQVLLPIEKTLATVFHNPELKIEFKVYSEKDIRVFNFSNFVTFGYYVSPYLLPFSRCHGSSKTYRTTFIEMFIFKVLIELFRAVSLKLFFTFFTSQPYFVNRHPKSAIECCVF